MRNTRRHLAIFRLYGEAAAAPACGEVHEVARALSTLRDGPALERDFAVAVQIDDFGIGDVAFAATRIRFFSELEHAGAHRALLTSVGACFAGWFAQQRATCEKQGGGRYQGSAHEA